MPEVWRKTGKDFDILVWQSTEPMTELLTKASLSLSEYEKWKSFISETRKREWLTVRIALNELLPHLNPISIAYDKNGKPFIAGDSSISISHSHEFIAVMISSAKRIGIDIEIIHPRIEKLSRKFVREDERKMISVDHMIEQIHVIWGTKEVLYKIHSVGSLEFIKDLVVHPFEFKTSGNLKASILNKSYKHDFDISYEKTEDYMITWGMYEY